MSYIRYSIICIFLALSFHIYQNEVDWWIYTPVIFLTAILTQSYSPKSSITRILSSIVIVFGTIQTIFLTWIIDHYTKLASTNGSLKEIKESKYTLPIALATFYMIYMRLTTSQSAECFGLVKSILLIILGISLIPCIAISLCPYNESLPQCNIFKLSKYRNM
uniref:Inner membrane protein n=1 Tax=Strongyloides venezuelensis TaxID=75913 RepID=A0A0K0F878_STRVS